MRSDRKRVDKSEPIVKVTAYCLSGCRWNWVPSREYTTQSGMIEAAKRAAKVHANKTGHQTGVRIEKTTILTPIE